MTNDNWARQNSAIGIKNWAKTPKSGWANTEGDSRWAIYLWVSWSPSVCALHFEFLKNRTSCSITREQWKTYHLSFSLGKPMDSISKFIYGRDPSFSAHVGLCDRVLSFCGATWTASQSTRVGGIPKAPVVYHQSHRWFWNILNWWYLPGYPYDIPQELVAFPQQPAVTSTWPQSRLPYWSNDARKNEGPVGGWWKCWGWPLPVFRLWTIMTGQGWNDSGYGILLLLRWLGTLFIMCNYNWFPWSSCLPSAYDSGDHGYYD